MKFDSVFHGMSQGAALHQLVYSPDGRAADYRILEINASFERHTGINAVQVKGRLASEAYGTGFAPYLTHYEAAVRTNRAVCFETFFSPLKKHFEVSICPSGPCDFATVFTDISARKTAEEERGAALAALAAHIAHELNTPAQFMGDNTKFLQDACQALCRLFRNHKELLDAAYHEHVTAELLARCRLELQASEPDYLLEQVPLALSETLQGIEKIAKIGRAMTQISHSPPNQKWSAELTSPVDVAAPWLSQFKPVDRF